MSYVFVYYNSTRKVFSIKALEGVSKGKVVTHATKVLIDRPVFKVNEAGRQRVLRTGRKNVHAGVQGYLRAYTPADYDSGKHGAWFTCEDENFADLIRMRGERVQYNPHKCGYFFNIQWDDDRSHVIPVHEGLTAYLETGTKPLIFVKGSQALGVE